MLILVATLVLAACEDGDDVATSPDPAPVEPADAAETAGGSAGDEAAPDPAEAEEPVESEPVEPEPAEPDPEPTEPADEASGEGGGADDGGAGEGGGADGDCVGGWMTDNDALEASLEAVMASQGVEARYEVVGNGILDIREDGAVIVEYNELTMVGDIGVAGFDITFTWAATGTIIDGELALESFDGEPVVDASMVMEGVTVDMNDMVADMNLTAGFASPEPVEVTCDGESVTLTPSDDLWALRFIPIGM
jgi:hypothetical protein